MLFGGKNNEGGLGLDTIVITLVNPKILRSKINSESDFNENSFKKI